MPKFVVLMQERAHAKACSIKGERAHAIALKRKSELNDFHKKEEVRICKNNLVFPLKWKSECFFENGSQYFEEVSNSSSVGQDSKNVNEKSLIISETLSSSELTRMSGASSAEK